MLMLAIVSGLSMGAMYGLLALGFHMTYAVSNTVNFAQGTSLMLGAVLAYLFSVSLGLPIVPSIVAALALCAVWGMLVERFAVRPFARAGSNAWLMSTVAVGIILEQTMMFTFGKEPRTLVLPVSGEAFTLGGLAVSPLQIAILVVAILVAACLHVFAQRTRYGKALLAIVQNPQAASLMGIDVTRAVMYCYAASTVLAGIAGILIAPLFSVSAEMGTLFGLKAFAVAILGGLNSARGVVLAGFLFGVVEALITSMLGSAYTNILAFLLVIVALAIKPHGLLGRAGVKKV
ncbi:MAG: branched-chain amino acid ABC transporter permease [Pyrinomonadaceae bacterium]|nr:branched-chain amino acid ABC transporter permease [Pyrinomonadaceae bacterium]